MRKRSESAEMPVTPEPELHSILGEFRTALVKEIQAAREAASSSAVSLVDGRRISAVGEGIQYSFRIEDNLNVPADSPGQLFVDGRTRVDCTIVSVEGMMAVISVEADLGSFVPHASLQSSLADLMRRLIDRIETLGDAPNPVGDRIVGRRVCQECSSLFVVEELIKASASDELVCPACGGELIAKEGSDTPIFYSCSQCTYTRNVDIPAPQNGLICCPKCGGDVDYGSWGEKPAWRCTQNRHHHLNLDRSHLLLPAMRARMPADQLCRLEDSKGVQTEKSIPVAQQPLFTQPG